MKTLRIIVLIVTALFVTVSWHQTQAGVQGGIFLASSTTSVVSVKAKSSSALNGSFANLIVTMRWLTSYNITLTLVSANYNIVEQNSGVDGIYSYKTFGHVTSTPINWAAGSQNELFTARADGNPGMGTFELTNSVPGNTQWYFEMGTGDSTNTTTPFYASSVSNVRLPVQLSRFIATVVNQRQVRLDWTTISEVNNYGFYVERRRNSDSSLSFMEVPNSFIAGHGTTNETHNYTFTDQSPGAPTVWYRLRQVDLDGTPHYTDPIQASGIVSSVEGKELAPIEFALKQNYPNPFNPSTEIKFSVETLGRTTLEVFNIIGQKVATLFDDVAEPGQYYKVRFGGANLASGMYLYRLQSGKKSELKKLVLLK